ARAVVGEARAGVAAGGGTHGDGVGRARRRVVAGVGAVVAGRDHHGDAGIDHVLHRLVGGAGGAAAEAHVGHRRLDVVVGHPVHASDHAGVGAAAVAAQHPHRMHPCRLGDAIGGARHRAGDVGAVAIAVVGAAAVVDGGVTAGHATAELAVAG